MNKNLKAFLVAMVAAIFAFLVLGYFQGAFST